MPLRDEACAEENPAQDLDAQAPAAALLRERDAWPVEAPLHEGCVVIPQVLAYALQLVHDRDTVLAQDVGIADAGELEELGVFAVPAQTITSCVARALCIVPSRRKRIPTHREPSRRSEVASAPVRIVRFGRFRAGRRYEVAVLSRSPRWAVSCAIATPCCGGQRHEGRHSLVAFEPRT